MVMIRAVQVRLTGNQHEQLKHNAEMRGFSSLASYIRYVALEQDFVTKQKIFAIHDLLLGNEVQQKKNFKKNMVKPM